MTIISCLVFRNPGTEKDSIHYNVRTSTMSEKREADFTLILSPLTTGVSFPS